MKAYPHVFVLLSVLSPGLSPGLSSGAGAPSPRSGAPIALPVRDDEHRFVLEPELEDGTRLRFYTDSGGGNVFLFSATVDRLKLPTKTEILPNKNQILRTAWPVFADKATIPPSLDPPYLIVVPEFKSASNYDGFLGQSWFAGRVWTFDYPGHRLLWRAPRDVPPHDKQHEVPLGFLKNDKGVHDNEFPRIQVTIDGEVFDFLFDTGATTKLTAKASKALGDNRPAERAGSFITARTFKKWHTKHPDWRVIDNAEQGSGESMIEARAVTIAGWAGVPVWFTRRADENFTRGMSSMMDKPVEGAFGGSGLYPFRITVDYVQELAVFEKP